MIDTEFKAACEKEFANIRYKLDRLDEAIRGNGKPGIMLRLDRLEQNAQRYSRFVWIIIGSAITAIVSILAAWFSNCGGQLYE